MPVIEYTLIRSDRRTLALEIAPDLTVVVRAPRRCAKREIARFVESHEGWISRHREIQRQRQQTPMVRAISPEEERCLRDRSKTYIPQRVEFYAARMGVTPAGVRITSAQKRFGSCSGKNSLCFSWRLMQYPPEAIDYVVVHELAHVRHHDHSAAFWRFVEETMPDYRRRRALLREN